MAYDIYDELFEDMQAGRDRLAREYNWFTPRHVSRSACSNTEARASAA